jgi:hypothetical protein
MDDLCATGILMARRKAAGDSGLEALRVLGRRLSDVVYASMKPTSPRNTGKLLPPRTNQRRPPLDRGASHNLLEPRSCAASSCVADILSARLARVRLRRWNPTRAPRRGMIDRVGVITTLASVALGAVLAMAGGIGTERWKQRKEARAAARLVWLELVVDYSTLLVAVALEEWPAQFSFSDDAWNAQRDRLALVRSAQEFRELQTAYLVLRQLAQTRPDQRGDPVLYWPVLASADKAVRALGEAGGIESAQLDPFRTPLQDRLVEIRTTVARTRAMPGEGQGDELDDPVAETLDQFPPELRAHAAEAIARARSGASEPGLTMDGVREPASEDRHRTAPSREDLRHEM